MFKQNILRVLFVLVLILGFSPTSFSAEFNVTDEIELQNALSNAGSNGEDDTINIAAGTYNTSDTLAGIQFTYDPLVTEDFDLTLNGEAAETTILDGDGINLVLNITTAPVTMDLEINNLTIQNGNGSESGGLRVLLTGDVTIDNCVFQNNDSMNDAGGASIRATDVTLSNNIFQNNNANNGFGGAVFINGEFGGDFDFVESVTINNSEFRNNTADGSGGGLDINSENVEVILTNNNFVMNSAGGSGGGGSISCCSLFPGPADNARIENNIFFSNSADFNDGGLTLLADTGNIINNTFTLNSAGTTGGGLAVSLFSGEGPINIFNNIIFNNTAAINGEDIRLNEDTFVGVGTGGIVNIFNNDFSDLFSVCDDNAFCTPNNNFGNNIDQDPLFVDVLMENVALQAGSPAVDTGDNLNCSVEDQTGLMRPQDGDEDGVAICDMGAIELIIAATESGGSGCALAKSHSGILDLSIVMLFPALIFIRRLIIKK